MKSFRNTLRLAFQRPKEPCVSSKIVGARLSHDRIVAISNQGAVEGMVEERILAFMLSTTGYVASRLSGCWGIRAVMQARLWSKSLSGGVRLTTITAQSIEICSSEAIFVGNT